MDEVPMLGKLWCILSFAIILSSAGNFYDCGSKVGNYSSVTITNCGTAPICILKRNSNVTIQFDFTPFENTNTVSAVAQGKIFALQLLWNTKICI